MNDSILIQTRVAMGLLDDDTSFDTELCQQINSALATLWEGSNTKSIRVIDETGKWEDLDLDDITLNWVQDYVYMYTRIVFDPPPQGTQTYMEKRLEEILWRINIRDEIS